MSSWVRAWSGFATDPKFLVVARKAEALPGEVSAVWAALIDHAGQQGQRGDVSGFDVETYCAFSGFDEAKVRRVVDAFGEKGMIVGGRLAAWERRQPKREDDSRERVRKHRGQHRNDGKRDVTQGNAPEQSRADSESEKLASQPNDRILEACLAAIGRERSTMPPAMARVDVIEDWMRSGFDLDLHILPALRAKGATIAGKRANSWQWFEKAVGEMRVKAPVGAAVPVDTTWVAATDARFPALAERERRSSPGKAVRAIRSAYHAEEGRTFPNAWVAELTEGQAA